MNKYIKITFPVTVSPEAAQVTKEITELLNRKGFSNVSQIIENQDEEQIQFYIEDNLNSPEMVKLKKKCQEKGWKTAGAIANRSRNSKVKNVILVLL